MTPPTGCAHSPGCSSQPHPTGSTRLHGSRWQTACLRERRHVHVSCRLTSLGGVRVRAPSFISLIIGWLTVDVDKRSNLVLVVRQTADLSHWYRGVGGDGQPVDHYQKKEGTGFFTALVFVHLLDFFSYWSPYPWQQLRSSSAAPLMRLFLQNPAPPPENSINQFVCKQRGDNSSAEGFIVTVSPLSLWFCLWHCSWKFSFHTHSSCPPESHMLRRSSTSKHWNTHANTEEEQSKPISP